MGAGVLFGALVPAVSDAAEGAEKQGKQIDAVIGIPDEGLAGRPDAGMVEVRFDDGSHQGVFLNNVFEGDRFGASTAVVDVDGDGYTDLLVGAPGRIPNDGETFGAAGAVYICKGSATGLHRAKPFQLMPGHHGLPGKPQVGAGFGATLSAERHGAIVEVAVGAPGWDVGKATAAGAVFRLVYEDGDHSFKPHDAALVTEKGSVSPGDGDHFGQAVLMQGGLLSAGAPGRTVHGQRGAGLVISQVQDARVWVSLTQDTAGMPGAPEEGDAFGSALAPVDASLWIGAPGEDVGKAKNAGMVNTYGDFNEDGVFAEPGPGHTQNSKGVKGAAETGDRFGSAIASYPYEEQDYDNILVGVPGEDLGDVRNAGMVNGFYNAPDLTENSTAGKAAAGDRFGATLLARTSFDPFSYRLLVGAPGKDGGAGAVVVAKPEPKVWRQGQMTGTPESGDGYGSSLAWSRPK